MSIMKSYFKKHPKKYSVCCLNTKLIKHLDPKSNFDATYHYWEKSIQRYDQSKSPMSNSKIIHSYNLRDH